MWAARVSVALEDAAEGEALTDQILHDAEVSERIDKVRRDPKRWAKLMLSAEERKAGVERPAAPPLDELEEVESDPGQRIRGKRPRREEADD